MSDYHDIHDRPVCDACTTRELDEYHADESERIQCEECDSWFCGPHHAAHSHPTAVDATAVRYDNPTDAAKAALTPVTPIKVCSCGAEFLAVPPGAKLNEEGAWWTCGCGSTAFLPNSKAGVMIGPKIYGTIEEFAAATGARPHDPKKDPPWACVICGTQCFTVGRRVVRGMDEQPGYVCDDPKCVGKIGEEGPCARLS